MFLIGRIFTHRRTTHRVLGSLSVCCLIVGGPPSRWHRDFNRSSLYEPRHTRSDYDDDNLMIFIVNCRDSTEIRGNDRYSEKRYTHFEVWKLEFQIQRELTMEIRREESRRSILANFIQLYYLKLCLLLEDGFSNQYQRRDASIKDISMEFSFFLFAFLLFYSFFT